VRVCARDSKVGISLAFDFTPSEGDRIGGSALGKIRLTAHDFTGLGDPGVVACKPMGCHALRRTRDARLVARRGADGDEAEKGQLDQSIHAGSSRFHQL